MVISGLMRNSRSRQLAIAVTVLSAGLSLSGRVPVFAASTAQANLHHSHKPSLANSARAKQLKHPSASRSTPKRATVKRPNAHPAGSMRPVSLKSAEHKTGYRAPKKSGPPVVGHKRHHRLGKRRHPFVIGQKSMDARRATEIQQALIQAHYLSGEPTGQWDQATQAAMVKYQTDNGWQSRITPDSRALIKLGLGPKQDDGEYSALPAAAETSAVADPVNTMAASAVPATNQP